MISYFCHKVNKINNRSIKIDIAELKFYKKKMNEEVKEVGISNIIFDFKHQMDNIPYNTIKNLAEILILYDDLELFYEFAEPITDDEFKEFNKKLKQVDFIPKKIKASIINDNSELFKMMITPGNEIDAREYLVYYREIIMSHFLENEDLKQSLSMMKYYYIKKNNEFVKKQMYRNNDLKKKNYYQSIANKIIEFYFNYCDYDNTSSLLINKREMKQSIIGYKNNIPVLNPKFFNCLEKYSFTRQLFRNIRNLVTLPF
jgi:hypothetical protein